MTFIPNEIPSGAIDGVNKIYTTLNNIDKVTTLVFDGGEYLDFTVDGNIITLLDAPTTNIWLDYITAGTEVSSTSICTLGDMISEVYRLTGQTSNSTNFSRLVIIDNINDVTSQIWKGRYTSILDSNRVYRAGDLWFQEANTGYRIQSGSKLTAVLNIGDIIAEMDTTNLLSAGQVQIGSDIITYTSKTDTQLNGVSGITTQHLIADKVLQLYELPANFFKPNTVKYILQSDDTESNLDIPFKGDINYSVFYDIIRDNGKILLKVVGLKQDDQLKVNYTQLFSELTLDTEECILPDNYGRSVIARIVAGEMMYEYGMPTGERVLNKGYSKLQGLFQEFTNTPRIIKQSIKPIFKRSRTRL